MKIDKIYLFSRNIHRFFAIITSFLTLIMAFTGLILKLNSEGKAPKNIDVALARYLHNQISLFFTIFLSLMIITGLIMYFYPLLKKLLNKNHLK